MFVKVTQVVKVKNKSGYNIKTMFITSYPITVNFLHETLCLRKNTSETPYLYICIFKINQCLNLCNSRLLNLSKILNLNLKII